MSWFQFNVKHTPMLGCCWVMSACPGLGQAASHSREEPAMMVWGRGCLQYELCQGACSLWAGHACSSTVELSVEPVLLVELSHQHCYILLLCNRWQQRGSLTKWRLTWKHGWSKRVSLSSSMRKNCTRWHLLTFAEHLWRQNGRYEYSEAATVM